MATVAHPSTSTSTWCNARFRHDAPANVEACVPVLLRTMAPFPRTLSLNLPLSTSSGDILANVAARLQLSPESASLLRLYARSGRRIEAVTTLRELASSPTNAIAFLDLEIRLATLGGKGGFGSMLRAQGGKMSARKGEENNDSCRDLNGRRLKTVKEAQSLAAYLAAAPARDAALSKAQAEKYAKLEKMLGRKPKDAKDFEEAAGRLDDAGGDLGQGSGDDDEEDAGAGPRYLVPVRGKAASSSGVHGGAGGKRGKLEDSKFLEESREAVDKAKSAVALAMAKRKKKEAAAKGAKVAPSAGKAAASQAPAAAATATAS